MRFSFSDPKNYETQIYSSLTNNPGDNIENVCVVQDNLKSAVSQKIISGDMKLGGGMRQLQEKYITTKKSHSILLLLTWKKFSTVF